MILAVAVLASMVGGGVSVFVFTHLFHPVLGVFVGILAWFPFAVFLGLVAGRLER